MIERYPEPRLELVAFVLVACFLGRPRGLVEVFVNGPSSKGFAGLIGSLLSVRG